MRSPTLPTPLLRLALISAVAVSACGETEHRGQVAPATPDSGGAKSDARPSTDGQAPVPDALLPLDGGLVAAVPSCTEVTLPGSNRRPGPWVIEGDVLVSLRRDAAGALVVRAPATLTPRTLTVHSEVGRATFQIRVEPDAGLDVALSKLGLAPDCAPFAQGVAAGDPTHDGAVLWTRFSPSAASPDARATLTWEVSLSPDFEAILFSGEVESAPSADHTAQVTVTGLASATTYYYRFVGPGDGGEGGAVSRTGRFKTAPTGMAERLRLALVSCSSLFSGYFTAYRRIAERDDLDFVLHLGDYIYDFVDEDEKIRVPEPFPEEPTDVATHRSRHLLYLLDPDLRAARAAHAWAVMWDNHDLEAGAPPLHEGGVQAFHEYVPTRLPDAENPRQMWRSLKFGDLLDLIVVDVLLWKEGETLPRSEARDMLGTTQRLWLDAQLEASTAVWRVIGNQKLFAPFSVPIDIGDSTWNGFPESRAMLLEKLAEPGIGDTLIVSGDAHFSVVADLPPDPMAGYDPATGAGSVAVELLGGSVSRGNVDESLRTGASVYERLDAVFRMLNPHFAHTNLIDHGWGLVEVTPERITVQMRYSPILEAEAEERADLAFEVLKGARHWNRAPVAGVSGP